jgi:hypothetical protein
MINKIWLWLTNHWQQRLFRRSTILAIVIIYLELFHNIQLTDFIQFLFNKTLRELIENITNDKAFITAIVTAIAVWLASHKKW